ncbi:MAG TPA: ABC transporter permease [Thermoanaerobaculia bacterium]|jgi:predicted permease
MASLSQDVRFGVRLLFRNPGHSLAAVFALALGIGLATAMFSIVYGAMMRGLPVPEPERILHLENANPSRDEPSLEVFLHDFLDMRERQTSFESLAGYYGGTLNLSGDGGQPERFNGLFLSASGFDLLRVRPVLGRGFLPGEDTPQAEPVAVISYGVWKSRYQRDPKVLGKPVRINGQPGTIVGVMPQGFAFPESAEVWTPLRLDPLRIARGQGETLEVMGRLRDGVTPEEARAEMVGIARALAAEHPKTNQGREAVVKPWMEEALGEEIPKLLWTMLAACIFVLLIACTNVASLMVARASRRTREIAIRSSLGAGRGRIVTQLLTESLLLSLVGAALGVLLALWGVRVFNAAIAGTNPPFWIRITIDAPALLFTLGVTLLAAVLSGLLPALQASRTDVGEVLKDEGRGSSSLRLGRLSRFVVIGEVAFSCVLLIAAGLMVRSVVAVRNLDLGFDPANLFTARIALFESTYPKEADRVRFFDDLLQRLEGLPAVASVATTTNLPGGGSGLWQYRVEGRTYATERDLPLARLAMVSPGFFEVFGARLLAGRNFGAQDNAGSLPVAIVNKSFAEKVWPGEDPVGKRLRLQEEIGEPNPPWRTVIGVAPDLQMAGLSNGPNPNQQETPGGFYLPLSQRCPGFVSLVARSRTGNPLALTPLVRQQVNALDRDLPIYFVFSMEEVLARGRFFPNLFGSLFAIFGVAALVLASVGIYGVIAFSVNQRTQEIGIRMALGAEQRNVLRMILRQGMKQLLFGLGAGLLVAVFFSKLLASFLIGVQPRDPVTFTLVALVLATVALVASWIPARRAMRTDPLVAIRYD